jgi:hypothetical protein
VVGRVVLASAGTLETIEKERLIVLLDTERSTCALVAISFASADNLKVIGPRSHSSFVIRTDTSPRAWQMKVAAHPRHHQVRRRHQGALRLAVQFLRQRRHRRRTHPFDAQRSHASCFLICPNASVDIDGRLSLSVVNGFTARELLVTGATMRIGTKPKVDIECALIVWYDTHGSGH